MRTPPSDAPHGPVNSRGPSKTAARGAPAPRPARPEYTQPDHAHPEHSGPHTPDSRPSTFRAWILAIRPITLGASLIPVLVGSALAAEQNAFRPSILAVCALAALCLQITTNLANDVFDYLGAIDTAERIGPQRATQMGWLAPRQVFCGIAIALGIAFACGVYLVSVGGAPILAIGLAALVAALAYSAGPFPLASHGLGEVTAFVFFGVVAITGSAYLHQDVWTWTALMTSLPIACVVSAIMVVNNLRDIPTDSASGKRTLAVRIGASATRALYTGLVYTALALCVPIALALGSFAALLPLLCAPLARRLVERVATSDAPADFGACLLGTAQLHAAYGLLLCIGLLL